MIPQIQLDFKYNFVCSNYDVPFQSLHPFIKKIIILIKFVQISVCF